MSSADFQFVLRVLNELLDEDDDRADQYRSDPYVHAIVYAVTDLATTVDAELRALLLSPAARRGVLRPLFERVLSATGRRAEVLMQAFAGVVPPPEIDVQGQRFRYEDRQWKPVDTPKLDL
jgi:hypothetical protein